MGIVCFSMGKELERGCLDGASGRSRRIRMFFAGQCGDNRGRSSDWFGWALASAELRSAAGSEKPYLTERHLLELADMKQGSLYEKDHQANLDALCVSPEVTTSFDASILQRSIETIGNSRVAVDSISGLVIADIDPSTAKLAVAILGPSLSAFGFLFIARIVMSWYPKLPVDEFPYVLAYAPTEPLLTMTRKVIPPLGGVDVTPVVWFGIISFLNEILDGPQGLLVLLSQQVS
ncbi:hypothetical protein MLD38_019674 [Melastoma candidum]|uniref:Uncharacterized protein n=1 Tax=Melastoma candidum TaxID=119954 RepID=A0ACB9QXQ7_9MYRT|nr:hypothetical protein MLD38_019674 [Melastoma candidum]